MTFILNARYFLVTYPQCGTLDEWAVNDHFGSLGAECIVGREVHVDGGTHLHVFCDFGRKFRSRRADIFDVDGHHPNIERSKRNPRKGADYATKDGDIVAGGLAVGGLPTTLVSGAQDPGSTLVCCENRGEFFEVAEDICPWDLITKFGSMHAYAKWKWPEVGLGYERPPGLMLSDGAFPDLVSFRNELLAVRSKCILCVDSLRARPLLRLRLGPPEGGACVARVSSTLISHLYLGLGANLYCSWKSEDPSGVWSFINR